MLLGDFLPRQVLCLHFTRPLALLVANVIYAPEVIERDDEQP